MNWATLRNDMIKNAIEYGIGNVIDEAHDGAYSDDECGDYVGDDMHDRIDAFALDVMREVDVFVTMTIGDFKRNAMIIALLEGGVNDDHRAMSHDTPVNDDAKQQFVQCLESMMH